MRSWELIMIVSGGILNVCALLYGLWKVTQIGTHIQRTFDYFALEHEILIKDFCERQTPEIDIAELPTRLKKAPWWGNA